jgi:hypothetical protein
MTGRLSPLPVPLPVREHIQTFYFKSADTSLRALTNEVPLCVVLCDPPVRFRTGLHAFHSLKYVALADTLQTRDPTRAAELREYARAFHGKHPAVGGLAACAKRAGDWYISKKETDDLFPRLVEIQERICRDKLQRHAQVGLSSPSAFF